jgi:hypothetical protein
MAHTIYIRGIPGNTQVKDVRVHVTPGLNTDAPFRIAVGATATCTDVKPDPANDNFQGQVYKWFNLTFGDGRTGWVRDDLLDLEGDLTQFGYGTYAARTFAFSAGTPAPKPAAQPAAQATAPASPAAPAASAAPAVTVNVAPTAPAQPAVTVSVGTPPAAPSVTVSVNPPAQPATQPVTTPAAAPAAAGDATVRLDIRAKIRSAPSIQSDQVGFVEPGMKVMVTGGEAGQDGQSFRWAKINFNGIVGYIREDLLNFSDNCTTFGFKATPAVQSAAVQPGSAPSAPATLNTQVRFPSPLRDPYQVFQEFGDTRFGSAHKGADLSRQPGVPIYASGSGIVAYTMRCTKCRDDAPNFQSQGLGFWDPQAIRDPAWGYGFGNHVVVRYAWADLPSSMRNAMAAQNLSGGYTYVIHAHMSRIDVVDKAPVTAGTQLGLLGNTGNSSGPHLHLEVRVSLSPNETNIFNRIVLNPRLMYDF